MLAFARAAAQAAKSCFRESSRTVKNGTQMELTAYQAEYYAYELQRSYANDHVGKLAGLLFDAQVEPKPHQIDAALFALQTPYLKGIILADEVGLGSADAPAYAVSAPDNWNL